jgi:hypothetical protein
MRTGPQKCGASEECAITFSPSSAGFRWKKSATETPSRAADDLCDDGGNAADLPERVKFLTRRKQICGNATKQLRQVETAVG